MGKKLGAEETDKVIGVFYKQCLKFWKKENVSNPEEKALCDVRSLTRNPFSPNGEDLDKATVGSWGKNNKGGKN